MQGEAGSRHADEQPSLSALFVLAVLAMVFSARQAVGLCIVFRLAGRVVPGCVPAWSANRAPPGIATVS